MIDEHFKDWLVKNGMGNKSANDVLSRCRRIEKVLELSLNTSVKNTKDAEKIATMIREKQSKFFGAKTKTVYAVAVVVRAVNLYGEYRQSK
jgi:hypothetical protein